MVDVGYATLGVIPSVKGLRAELEKQTKGDLAAAGKSTGKTYGDAAGKSAASGFGASFKGNFVGPLAAGAATAGVIAGFKDLFNRASAAQQAVGGVQAVFKDYADGVIADSEKADQALGLSKTAYQELITVSGALLKNKGLEDFAEQAENLVGIGADLAAQFGGSTQKAVDALNAALRGESDPAEQYAISLNETAVKAELAAKGQSALTGAALEQAKTQARLALITQQSADAQGAFARESDTAAGSGARLSAQWANMRAELGDKLLPATSEFISFLNTSVLPGLEAAGGVVSTAARTFNELPGPIKAATAALVAFKIAQATGLSSSAASGFSSLSNGLDSLRLRAMLAADSYNQLRAGQVQVINGSGTFTPAVGRMASALGALQTASAGAGTGLKRGLSGALSLIGGPWGAALAVGTLAVAHFWREHQKAKQRVEDFTATLDKQTGALTESSREFAAKALLDEGVLKSADQLGISLSSVTDAALDEAGALQTLNAELDRIARSRPTDGLTGAFDEEDVTAALKLKGVVNDTNGVVQKGIAQQKLFGAALGETGADAAKTAQQTSGYATTIEEARGAVQKLLDVENERRNANRSAFGDRTALAQALSDARVEAAEGAKTLDLNTQAGRDNRNALADLADQWSNSADAVKNSRGAYEAFRQQFITIATQMGIGRDRAKELADRLLGIPRNTPAAVTTPGMDKALADLRAYKALLLEIRTMFRPIVAAQGVKNRGEIQATQPNGGAPAPRFSPGAGTTAPNMRTTNNGPAIYVENQYVQPQSYDQFLADQNNRARRAALDGIQR